MHLYIVQNEDGNVLSAVPTLEDVIPYINRYINAGAFCYTEKGTKGLRDNEILYIFEKAIYTVTYIPVDIQVTFKPAC